MRNTGQAIKGHTLLRGRDGAGLSVNVWSSEVEIPGFERTFEVGFEHIACQTRFIVLISSKVISQV